MRLLGSICPDVMLKNPCVSLDFEGHCNLLFVQYIIMGTVIVITVPSWRIIVGNGATWSTWSNYEKESKFFLKQKYFKKTNLSCKSFW